MIDRPPRVAVAAKTSWCETPTSSTTIPSCPGGAKQLIKCRCCGDHQVLFLETLAGKALRQEKQFIPRILPPPRKKCASDSA